MFDEIWIVFPKNPTTPWKPKGSLWDNNSFQPFLSRQVEVLFTDLFAITFILKSSAAMMAFVVSAYYCSISAAYKLRWGYFLTSTSSTSALVCTNNAGVYDLGKHTRQGWLSAGWRLRIDYATRNATQSMLYTSVHSASRSTVQLAYKLHSTCCALPYTFQAKLQLELRLHSFNTYWKINRSLLVTSF